MREFKTICKDSVTGMIMVLKEASFNNACEYLEAKLGSQDYVGCEYVGGNVTKLKWKTKCFYYDENRGYLMRREIIKRN